MDGRDQAVLDKGLKKEGCTGRLVFKFGGRNGCRKDKRQRM